MYWCNNELIIIAPFSFKKDFCYKKRHGPDLKEYQSIFECYNAQLLTINQNIKVSYWIFDKCIVHKKKCLSCSYFNAPWWHYNIQVHCNFYKNIKLLNFGFKVVQKRPWFSYIECLKKLNIWFLE